MENSYRKSKMKLVGPKVKEEDDEPEI